MAAWTVPSVPGFSPRPRISARPALETPLNPHPLPAAPSENPRPSRARNPAHPHPAPGRAARPALETPAHPHPLPAAPAHPALETPPTPTPLPAAPPVTVQLFQEPALENREIARLLQETADLMEIAGDDPFREVAILEPIEAGAGCGQRGCGQCQQKGEKRAHQGSIWGMADGSMAWAGHELEMRGRAWGLNGPLTRGTSLL